MRKKTLTAIAVAMSAFLALTGCGAGGQSGSQAGSASQEETQQEAPDASEAKADEGAGEQVTEEETAGTETENAGQEDAAQTDEQTGQAAAPDASEAAAATADPAAEETAQAGGAMAVYFSRVGNTVFPENVDADSSASIRLDQDTLKGNAQLIAEWIAQEKGIETMEIVSEDPYPADYNETVDQAKQEQNDTYHPTLKADEKAVDACDTIYLAFPNWWGDLPMPVYSFFETHDFSGKTIYVFVTHEGSGFSRTLDTIKELAPGADVREGLSVQGGSVTDQEQNIRQWAAEN